MGVWEGHDASVDETGDGTVHAAGGVEWQD